MAINAASSGRNPYTELVAARIAAKNSTQPEAKDTRTFAPIPQLTAVKNYAAARAAYTQQDQQESVTSAAVIHTQTRPQQPPAPVQETQVSRTVSSILETDENAESQLPNRYDVLGLARRYVKAIGKQGDAETLDKEANRVADFYGASPERATRLAGLVQGLEDGPTEGEKQAESAVAVA